jgi:hypothetical protein
LFLPVFRRYRNTMRELLRNGLITSRATETVGFFRRQIAPKVRLGEEF